jgi:hypothetical protein
MIETPMTDEGAAGPQAPQADPSSFTGGQQFIQPTATMGGSMSDHPISDQPENTDDSQVTPEEQKQYDDFVTRAKLFINDSRVPKNGQGKPQAGAKAPRDVIVDHLNIKGMSAAEAVGRTTAQVAWILYTAAKRAGMPYSPDVIYHGADEIMSDLYQIGVSAGVIKNPPPAGSQEEEHLLGMAKLAAAKYFGQNLINTGQANQQQAQQYYLEQIQREGESGGLDDWDPSKQFTPGQLSTFMQKASRGQMQIKQPGGGAPSSISDFAARGNPQLVPPDQSSGAPDQSQDQSGGQ